MHLEIITKKPNAGSHRPPLLLIHGAWHGAWCWERFQAYFAEQGYESHALSLRGHGASEGRERLNRTRIADYVADVASVAARLPGPPVLIGHSMGGFIIQKYLEQHSAAAAILLVPIPVHGMYRMFFRFAASHPWQAAKCLVMGRTLALIETPALVCEAFFSPDIPEETVQACCDRIQDESYCAGWDTLLFDLPKPERTDPPPLLVLGAADDALFYPDEIEATAQAYGARHEIIPAMAHDMMMEKNWQHVAARIVEWLDEVGLSLRPRD